MITLCLIIFCQQPQVHAEQIIMNCVQAMGGEKALRGITSIREEGVHKIYLQGELYREAPFVSLEKAPSKSYYESPTGLPKYSPVLIFASNGKLKWTQNDGAMAPYPMSQSETFSNANNTEKWPYLLTLKERGINVSYRGTVQEGDASLHHLVYTHPNQKTEDVFFDTTTHFLVKMSRAIHTSQGPSHVTRLRKDYTKVGNVVLPQRTESIFPGEHSIYQITKREVNVDIDDRQFELPEEPKLGKKQRKLWVGQWSVEGVGPLTISEQDETLVITLPDQAATPLQIVHPTLCMFRLGQGAGSWMINLQLEDREIQWIKIKKEKETRLIGTRVT